MKPGFNLRLVVLAATFMSSFFASAQDISFRTSNEYRTSGLYAAAIGSLNMKDKDADAMSTLKVYSPKAYRHFNRDYKSSTDIHVTQGNGNTFIYCILDGIVNRIGYDKKGNWNHTIRYYDAGKLDKSLRNSILNNYKGYEIRGVTEVAYAGELAYFVSIECLSSWTVLRIQNDSMEEMDTYHK